MELNLPASKTDPFRKGRKLTIAASYDTRCPVQARRALLDMDNHSPDHAPLFCLGKFSQQAFTREYVVARLQELAIITGLGQGNQNGHSFRRGAATGVAEVEISVNKIQTLGRGRSDAYKMYIEFSRKEQISLSQRFQRSLPSRQVT